MEKELKSPGAIKALWLRWEAEGTLPSRAFNVIKKTQQYMGITQKDLAKCLGVSCANVYRWLAGNDPSMISKVRVAASIGLPSDFLYFEDDSNKIAPPGDYSVKELCSKEPKQTRPEQTPASFNGLLSKRQLEVLSALSDIERLAKNNAVRGHLLAIQTIVINQQDL